MLGLVRSGVGIGLVLLLWGCSTLESLAPPGYEGHNSASEPLAPPPEPPSAVAPEPEERRPVFEIPELARGMLGADTHELINKYGEPAFILDLPTGQRAYAYDPHGKSGVRDDGTICKDTFVIDADNIVVKYFCR